MNRDNFRFRRKDTRQGVETLQTINLDVVFSNNVCLQYFAATSVIDSKTIHDGLRMIPCLTMRCMKLSRHFQSMVSKGFGVL